MTDKNRIDIGQIARDLANSAEAFCRHFFPNGRKVGNYWQMGDTAGNAGQSLTIRLQCSKGRSAGKWVDHATGEYGDLLDLLNERFGPLPFKDLMDLATTFLGTEPVFDPDKPPIRTKGYDLGRQAKAGRRLFGYGHPISGTVADTYLRNRKIGRFGRALKYHPNVYLRGSDGQRVEYPALLAAMTDNDGRVTGCSRTFLDYQTAKCATIASPKRILGTLNGNAIRFGPWQTARDLIVGEGLENTLSVGTVFPRAALASCLTAHHMAVFNWPAAAMRLWIVHDNDDVGERGARHLQSRAVASGISAFLLSAHHDDFNDDLRIDGATALRLRVSQMISTRIDGHDLWPAVEAA